MNGRPDGAERRRFLRLAASGAVLTLGACASAGEARERGEERGGEESEEGISPAEDLMREHGLLERVLLVYDECGARLRAGGEAPMDVLGSAAGIVRDFVEAYHEKLEELHLFPRLEAAHREVELVGVLRTQHARGRELTGRILQGAALGADAGEADRGRLAQALADFGRMYRPHAAREDTVLFPAFESILGADALAELGEQFEEREHELLGADGFEGQVRKVADLERALGIHDLARFTPA